MRNSNNISVTIVFYRILYLKHKFSIVVRIILAHKSVLVFIVCSLFSTPIAILVGGRRDAQPVSVRFIHNVLLLPTNPRS